MRNKVYINAHFFGGCYVDQLTFPNIQPTAAYVVYTAPENKKN